MFGIGFTELIIIGIIALLVVGPDKLPEAATKIGRFIWDLRRAWDDVRDNVRSELMTVKQPFDEIRRGADQAREAIKKEALGIKNDTAGSVKKELDGVKAEVTSAAAAPAAKAADKGPAKAPEAAPAQAAEAPAAAPAEEVVERQPYRPRPAAPAGIVHYDLDGNPIDPPVEA